MMDWSAGKVSCFHAGIKCAERKLLSRVQFPKVMKTVCLARDVPEYMSGGVSRKPHTYLAWRLTMIKKVVPLG